MHERESTKMSDQFSTFRLILVGVLPRISIAAVISALLWLGFLWATATPGAI